MPDQRILINPGEFLQKNFKPSIVTWNRLEGRPRRADFERSLRVEVRDPLWMLCRQWQFGEFKGEDAGSALLAKVQVDSTQLNRYAAQPDNALSYDQNIPLEVQVESERIPFDLRTRIQMGRHWLALLNLQELPALYELYVQEYPFELPVEAEQLHHLESDAKALQQYRAVENRLADGSRIFNSIDDGTHDQFVDNSTMTLAEKTQAREIAIAFKDWFARIYQQPDALQPPSWAPSYLEYQFSCSAGADPQTDDQLVLSADQYHNGSLDWYSFDRDSKEKLIDAAGETPPVSSFETHEPITFLPTPVEFAGMPNKRWWEFEDQKTDLGNLNASTTDLALLLIAEFGLIYGNDWSVLPYDLTVGSLSDVKGIVITDVFGIKTLVQPAAESDTPSKEHWAMFNLGRDEQNNVPDTTVFLPPVLGKAQESAPIERVMLARDEMANMVWGVEHIIPGVIGSGTKGYEAATDLLRHLAGQSPPVATEETEEISEAIQYRLGTRVPENWIPFIAVREPASNREVRLQRATMPRPGTPDLVAPRGKILGVGLGELAPQPYFINEEEVPRAGVVTSRSFQRARWFDGRVYTWIGRRKQVGKGEAASGLAFDQIIPVDQASSKES